MAKRTERMSQLAAALATIERKHKGRLTKRDVVAEARSQKTDAGKFLYGEFAKRHLWDDAVAAERARENFAGVLIVRYVTMKVVDKNVTTIAPVYVRDPTAATNEQGYVALTSKERSRQDAIDIVVAEVDRCRSAIQRARNVAGALNASFPGLSDRLETMLRDLVQVREQIAA